MLSKSGRNQSVLIWLVVISVLLCAMVLIGGATRLTDSGLSITVWHPITGVFPPLSDNAWFDEFILYQGVPEYEIVNKGMTIDEFKTIYLWEWFHRNFGRLIGILYAVPFIFFVTRGNVKGKLAMRLTGILVLGGVQAWVGWYMVQSGLSEGIDVSQYRLAIHLGLAFTILGVTLWTIFDLAFINQGISDTPRRIKITAMALFALIYLQVLSGALVAGLRAGLSYNTWPSMNGDMIPDGMLVIAPWYFNFFENALTVQFDHRLIAYTLVVVAIGHAVQTNRAAVANQIIRSARWIVFLLCGQVFLGIATLVNSVPIWLGLIHQAMAIIVFIAACNHLHATWQHADDFCT